ncbi:cation diffusion facilitator family transporter [Paenibacillus sp. 1_12]|uniref:cation diffusion facilitator family transporter n=1 Tax=Paenibacillus sp. 1_12 TaxID=1566278 RepID=UPI003527779B
MALLTEERFQKTEFAYWIGIIGNIFLAALKGLFGYFSGSKALIADALYSVSTAGNSFAMLMGLRAAKKQPDGNPLYKQGKAESIAAIIVSVLLLVIGIEICFSSIKTIYYGVDSPPKATALIAIVISIILKEVMFQYKYRLGKKMSNQDLITSARKHRLGVYSSFVVLIGVVGALFGHYLGNNYLYYLDPLAGLFVAILVVRMGYRLVMESIHQTLEHSLHDEDVAELMRTVQVIKGVIAVEYLRAREQGHYVIVDIKISVNPRISVLEGHDIAKTVKQALLKRHIHVAEVYIHVNPYDAGYPYKNNIDLEQDQFSSMLH